MKDAPGLTLLGTVHNLHGAYQRKCITLID